jgi:hypothetical protein
MPESGITENKDLPAPAWRMGVFTNNHTESRSSVGHTYPRLSDAGMIDTLITKFS